MNADVLFDATPLDRDHAVRGIGAAVRGMAEGLAAQPPDRRPAFLVAGDGENAPLTPERYPVRWPDWRSPRIPDPWPLATVRRRIRSLAPRLFHATQADLLPDDVPSVVTLTADDAVALAGADPERVRVVPLAAPPTAIPAGEVPADPYILMSGGLEPHKNPWPVISALALLPEPLRLVMTGPWGGRRVRLLRDYANRAGVLDRIDLLGHVPASRLAALREGAVAVVVPSLKEGFGLPVLEAMQAGVPVVASDTPALREVGADAARYEDPFEPTAWADAIARPGRSPRSGRRRPSAVRRAPCSSRGIAPPS